MIKWLHGKPLLTCDHPDNCQHYLQLKSADDTKKIEEHGWLAFEIKDKLVFICDSCRRKALNLSPEQYAIWRQNLSNLVV